MVTPNLNVPQEIRLDSHELFVTLRRFVLVTEEGESNNSVNRVVYFFFNCLHLIAAVLQKVDPKKSINCSQLTLSLCHRNVKNV